MVDKDILKEITIDDLQEQHQALAEAIGLKNLIKLSESFGGTQIYIPQIAELTKELKYKKILEDYDGDNIQQLAIKYRVSESTVYRVVKDEIAKRRYSPMENQMSLFG